MSHSHEANQQVINTSRNTLKTGKNVKDNKSEFEDAGKPMTVFDEKAIKEMKNMASLRMYKCNGYFNNRVFSTCPSYP